MELVDRMKGIALKFAGWCKAKRMKRTQWGGQLVGGVFVFFCWSAGWNSLVPTGVCKQMLGAPNARWARHCVYSNVFSLNSRRALAHTHSETKRLEYEYKSVQFE